MKIKAEFTFPGELKNEPIIHYISTKFKIVPIIVEASFSTDVGWAYLILDGEKEELQRLFDYLKNKNIKTERIEEI
ncbi:MAG: NIL domain-containing protein [Candidatus Omnitrophota bacterium]